MNHQFNLQITPMHNCTHARAHTKLNDCKNTEHIQMCTRTRIKILQLFVSLYLIFSFHPCISPSLHFPLPAGDSLWNINYDALSRLCAWPTEKQYVCVCIDVFLEACVLPANDHCFRDLLPSFSLLLSVSLFPAPLTFNLVPQPPVSPTTPFLFPPPPPNPRCRFKQLALSSADTSSMQIESPPTLRLSHFFPVFFFSLPFRDYVVMRVSCLYGETFLTSLFFCSQICFLSLALVLSLSHVVPSLFLLLVTLIRSVCGPEMTCVLMWTEEPWLLCLVKCLLVTVCF